MVNLDDQVFKNYPVVNETDSDSRAKNLWNSAKLYSLLEILNNQMDFTVSSGKYKGHYHKPGYFCIARYDNNKRPRQYFYAPVDSKGNLVNTKKAIRNHVSFHKSFKLHDLLKIVYKHPKHNWYVYPNTYKKQSVKEICTNHSNGKNFENVNTILAFYLDLDVIKTFGDPHMMVTVLNKLPDILKSCGFTYNVIINSGHGFHVLMILKRGVYAGITDIAKAWSEVEKTACDKVSAKCKDYWGKSPVDHSVTNINRTLRISGSYNVKNPYNPKPCKVEYLNLNNRPDIKDVYHRFTGKHWTFGSGKGKYPKHYHIAYKSWKTGNSKLVNHHKKHSGVSHRTLGHLHHARCDDISHLIQLRNHRGMLDGYRNKALFLYACNMVMVDTVNHTRLAVKRLNNQLLRPSAVHLNKVLNGLGTDEQPGRIYEHTHNVKPGNKDWKMYWYSNDEIIKRLGITDNEQMEMITLISKSVAKKRRKIRYKARLKHQKAKRRPSVLKHKHEREIAYIYNPTHIKIMRLHKKGLSQRKISKHVDISQQAIGKVIKRVTTINNHLDTTYKESKSEAVKSKHNVSKSHNNIVTPDSDYKQSLLKLNQVLSKRRKTGDD